MSLLEKLRSIEGKGIDFVMDKSTLLYSKVNHSLMFEHVVSNMKFPQPYKFQIIEFLG